LKVYCCGGEWGEGRNRPWAEEYLGKSGGGGRKGVAQMVHRTVRNEILGGGANIMWDGDIWIRRKKKQCVVGTKTAIEVRMNGYDKR